MENPSRNHFFFVKIKKQQRQCNSECFPGAGRGGAPGKRVDAGRGLQETVPIGNTGAPKFSPKLGGVCAADLGLPKLLYSGGK